MQGTLIIAVLSIRGSYSRNVEEPVGEGDIPDTLQWWISSERAWRIRTYALDHDIHTHAIARGGREVIQTALADTLKHYGDVVYVQYVVEFQDCTDADEVRRVFEQARLAPRLEVAAGRFAFWKPDDARYRTQSAPT